MKGESSIVREPRHYSDKNRLEVLDQAKSLYQSDQTITSSQLPNLSFCLALLIGEQELYSI